ncbi:MAG TPA: hypothetical protein VII01_10565 [Solirubrobacteraceae bacterium]
MRNFKATFGLVAMVCLIAVMAVPALAAEFTASKLPNNCSEAEPCRTKGKGIGEIDEKHPEYTQKFVIGAFTIECKKAVSYAKTPAEGAFTSGSSSTFSTEVKFMYCLTEAKFGAFTGGLTTSFNGGHPVKFVYHTNGFAELGSGETEAAVEIGGAETTFKIAGKICTVALPPQTVPIGAVKNPGGEFSAAEYSNEEVAVSEKLIKRFPSGFQTKLVIANKFKGMKYHYESGQCTGEGGFEEEAKTQEGRSATYTGTLEEEVPGGNVGFTP